MTDILSLIRDAAPAVVVAHVAGEREPIRIAVPRQRKRWEALRTELDKIAWTRLELRDDRDNLISTIESPDADPLAKIDTRTKEGEIAALFLRGQEIVLDRFERYTKSVHELFERTVDRLSERLVAVEAERDALVEAIHALRAETTPSDDVATKLATELLGAKLLQLKAKPDVKSEDGHGNGG